MGNEGIVEIDLLDAAHQPAHDPQTRVRFFRSRDNSLIASSDDLVFPPAKQFTLPAFPQETNLYGEVAPLRFRTANTGFFTLRTTGVKNELITALKLPDKWNPVFVPWDSLPGEFDPLKIVLRASPGITIRDEGPFDLLVEGAYDGLTGENSILAKMSLLNLYFTLTTIREPTTGTNPPSWFSFVNQIFFVDRERFMAFVRPEMATLVGTIEDDIRRFPGYRSTPADNHFQGIQDALPPEFTVHRSRMKSIKTTPDHANIQLTMAPTRDPNGDEVMVLDADIDENGQLLAHLADLIRHLITGGTHPIDIHEYLILAYGNVALGYDLV
ncbi:MAG: hypothetical protein DMF61_11920 [Blastocatellia bacterium AA13]|nr:MAG: hypothetical protein DMF61_11920 [Blastocatellia bacterium AA13]